MSPLPSFNKEEPGEDNVIHVDFVSKRLEERGELKEHLKTEFEHSPLKGEIDFLDGLKKQLIDAEHHFTFVFQHILDPDEFNKLKNEYHERFKNTKIIDSFTNLIAKAAKGDLPSEEELAYLNRLYGMAESGKLFDPEIQHFLQKMGELKAYILKTYPKSEAAKELKRSKKIIHIQRYTDEVRMWEALLSKVEHDDPSWTFFREKLYKENERYAEMIRQRYGDETYPKIMTQFFREHKEDHPGTIAMLNSIINKLKSPESMKEAEREGADELTNILKHSLALIRQQVDKFRLEMISAVDERIKDIEGSIKTTHKKAKAVLAEQDEILKEKTAINAEEAPLSDQAKTTYAAISELKKKKQEMREEIKRAYLAGLSDEYMKAIQARWKWINWYNQHDLPKLMDKFETVTKQMKTLENTQKHLEKRLEKNLRKKAA